MILAVLVMILSFPTVGFGASSVNPIGVAEDSADQKNDSETEDQKEEAENIQTETVNSESEIDESDISIPETSSEERLVIEQDIAVEPDDQFEEEPSDEKTEEATGKENETDDKESDKDANIVEKQGDEEESESIVGSMRPLQIEKAYLSLNGESEEELKSMSLDTVLASIVDVDGNPIEISPDADTVWRNKKDDLDGVDEFEEYSIGKGERIDLSVAANVLEYQMELIIGSGNQLNSNNKRYNISVFVSDSLSEAFEFEFYQQVGESRKKIEAINIGESHRDSNYINEYNDGTIRVIPEHQFTFMIGSENSNNIFLGMTSYANNRPDIQIRIFELNSYLEGQEIDVSEQLLNQEMSQ